MERFFIIILMMMYTGGYFSFYNIERRIPHSVAGVVHLPPSVSLKYLYELATHTNYICKR